MNIISWKYKPVSFLDRMPSSINNVNNNSYAKEYDDWNWQPPIDIKEDNKSFTLIADVPGVNKKSIEAKIEGRILIIKGNRKMDEKKNEADYHYQERTFGDFKRSFKLPKSVKEDQISANFKDGTLRVILPKAEEEEPSSRLITIK